MALCLHELLDVGAAEQQNPEMATVTHGRAWNKEPYRYLHLLVIMYSPLHRAARLEQRQLSRLKHFFP